MSSLDVLFSVSFISSYVVCDGYRKKVNMFELLSVIRKTTTVRHFNTKMLP